MMPPILPHLQQVGDQVGHRHDHNGVAHVVESRQGRDGQDWRAGTSRTLEDASHSEADEDDHQLKNGHAILLYAATLAAAPHPLSNRPKPIWAGLRQCLSEIETRTSIIACRRSFLMTLRARRSAAGRSSPCSTRTTCARLAAARAV